MSAMSRKSTQTHVALAASDNRRRHDALADQIRLRTIDRFDYADKLMTGNAAKPEHPLAQFDIGARDGGLHQTNAGLIATALWHGMT